MKRDVFCVAAVLMLGGVPQPVQAADWYVAVGAQSRDLGSQAQAFLPNELWIHTADTVHWTVSTNELHTVTFLKPGQVRPPLHGALFDVFPGCQGNGATPDGSSFDGFTCVSSGPATSGESYSVTFPSAGNFKLVCLVHTDMTGVIHVLNGTEILPHDQDSYDRQADRERAMLLADTSRLAGAASPQEAGTVTAGIGQVVSTGGGNAMASLQLFLRKEIVVRVGDTVEWTNRDPSANHTVTFGIEPADPRPASPNLLPPDPDGARHAVISSPSDSVHSGFLSPTPQDRVGLAQAAPGVTRFRVTFMAPGIFNYICTLHDDIGMKGTVIVY
jgi:plastocyanin